MMRHFDLEIAMFDEETCDCADHGPQPITFVCNHITSTSKGDTVGFVSFASEHPDDLRDAWCGACNAYLWTHDGTRVEGEVEVPGGVDVICAQCYRDRAADAERAGRRVVCQVS
jgi:hypothetical protein